MKALRRGSVERVTSCSKRRGWGGSADLLFLERADAVAELGGALEFLPFDGAAELVFELFEFGQGAVFADLGGELAEGFEGALLFEFEGFVLDIIECLDAGDGVVDEAEGFVVVAFFEDEHDGGGGVDADDVGAPLFEVELVFEAAGVLFHEIEEAQIAGGVTEGAGPILELKEADVTEVIQSAFIEQLTALARTELELRFLAGGPGTVEPLQIIVEGGVHAVRAGAVGPAFELVLFEADGSADLHDFATVVALGKARVLVRVVGPALEDASEVHRIIHHANSMSFLEADSIPASTEKGSQGSIDIENREFLVSQGKQRSFGEGSSRGSGAGGNPENL